MTPDSGTTMTADVAPLPVPPASAVRRFLLAIDNRYLAPFLVTAILLVGHLSFGILESYTRTALAIVAAGSLPHLRDLHRFVPGVRAGKECDHRRPVVGQRCADHRRDVPALHLLHDHGSTYDRPAALGAVRRGRGHCGGGDAVAAGRPG